MGEEEELEERLIGQEEIRAIYEDEEREFNISILEEGIRQAELRLKDVNAVRHILEKRAYSLLYFFTSLIVAFISLLTVLISLNISDDVKFNDTYASLPGGLLVIAILIAITFIFYVFNSLEYGILGRPPNTWLGEGVMESEDENTKGYVLADILYDYQERIKVSEKANRKATQSIVITFIILISALFLFLAWIFIAYFCN